MRYGKLKGKLGSMVVNDEISSRMQKDEDRAMEEFEKVNNELINAKLNLENAENPAIHRRKRPTARMARTQPADADQYFRGNCDRDYDDHRTFPAGLPGQKFAVARSVQTLYQSIAVAGFHQRRARQ